MSKVPRGVTPAEAAFVTGLSIRAVNAAVDRKEVTPPAMRRRGEKPSRLLGLPELIYLTLRPRLSRVLSSASRRALYEEIKRRSRTARVMRATPVELGVVTVNYDEALRVVVQRLRELDAASRFVISDPAIRAGEAVIRGTRVPVHRLAELAEQGVSEQELLEDHPTVSPAALRAALTYARTHPRRGRPKRRPWRRSAGGDERVPKSRAGRAA